MKKLTAKYLFNLDHFVMVKRRIITTLNYNFKINDHDIVFKLNHSKYSGYSQKRKGESKSFKISEITLLISHFEEDIPPIKIKKRGRDFSERSEYFETIENKFNLVALEVMNNFIAYFKYRLNQPLLNLFNNIYPWLKKHFWLDEKGDEIDTGIIRLQSRMYLPYDYIKTGAIEFSSRYDKELLNKLKNPIKPKLYLEFLSDAQSAFFNNNFRRSIIEIAIACEVAVKHKFFFETEKSSQLYNFLEDKNKINIRVSELIDGVSKYVFGKSFKETYKNDFLNIDYLFRSRNKIAHRGELSFRDDKGKNHIPDEKMILNWWNSLYILLNWLESLK